MKNLKFIVSLFVLSIFILAASSVLVKAADFTLGTPTTQRGDPLTSVTVTVDITNNALTAKTYTVSSSVLTISGVGPGTISAPASTTTTQIGVNITGKGSLTINIPSTLAGTYTGILTVTDSSDINNKATVSYSVTVNSKASINFPDGTLKLQSEPKSKTLEKSFTIKNTGSVVLTSLQIPSISFPDSDSKSFEITGTVSQSPLNPGASTTATLKIKIPEDAALDVHTKPIVVNAQELTGSSFNLELRINPNACKNGPIGDVDVEIKDPDDGDDFEIGDTISLRVEVTNNDNDDHDYIVKAVLYDLTNNKKLESVESDQVNINDDDSDTIEFDLIIPTDENIDDGDDFAIFVKAFEDGQEDEFCNDAENIDISIDVPSHKVVIQDSSITPTSASCGDAVTASVDVKNVGSSNERNVRVRVREPTLNINVVSDTFELEEVGEDDEATQTLTFQVPGDAKPGQYTIELLAEPGTANKVSEFQTLQVSCETPITSVSLNLPVTTLKVDQGSTLNIPVRILNNAKSQKTLTVEARAIGDFASSPELQQITLAPGEEGSLTFTITVDQNAVPGSKTVLVTVKEAESLVTSKSVPVLVEGKSVPITGGAVSNGVSKLFGGSKNAAIFFIIGDILLVIIALYFIVLIFKKKRQ